MGWKSWRAERRRRKEEALERPRYGWIWKPLVAVVGSYLLISVALGIWWSQPPAPFDVEQATLERRGEAVMEPAVRGSVTLATLAESIATLLDKPGGYLRNDIAPPGVWLDNMPSWELGVLEAARGLVRALPKMAGDDSAALAEAQEALMSSDRAWLAPSTEQRLEEAINALEQQLRALESAEAGFAPGAGLADWLASVAADLDALAERLVASVADDKTRTPRYRVDNALFEARGTGWALMQLLEGVQRDQADVLEAAGAHDEWQRLLAELEATQRRLRSPVVLNGSGFGIFANHSLTMALHMTRARELADALAERLVAAPVPD